LVTSSEGFSKIELLLDEDTISGSESFPALLWLLNRGNLVLLRGILGRVLRRILTRRVLLRRILLGRILLRRILLRRILLRRILLGRVLLGIAATELDLDSLGLGLLRLHDS